MRDGDEHYIGGRGRDHGRHRRSHALPDVQNDLGHFTMFSFGAAGRRAPKS